MKHGLILRPLGNIIYLFLPFCIKPAELKTILGKTRFILDKLTVTGLNPEKNEFNKETGI